MNRRTVYDYTEPMLTEDEHAKRYEEAASDYNDMAKMRGWAGVPATLHAALYDTHHGEQDIRTAIQNAHDVMMALAGGLVSLKLVMGLRQKYGVQVCFVCKHIDCQCGK